MSKFIFFPLFFLSTFVHGQKLSIDGGFKISLLATIGSHQSNVGLGVNSYIGCRYAQLNAGTRIRLFGNNLGKRNHMWEWRHELGAILMAGPESNPIQFEYSAALHQQKSVYSLGYAYIWYVDNVNTTQRSGTWTLGLQRVDIQFENDVFGAQRKDRFRTGHFTVSYRDSINKFTVGIQLWTGETANSVWNHTPLPKCPSGFRDLTPLPYGKLNHGIFYVEMKRKIDYNQFFGGRVGFDSEQIRHCIQNRFVHDLIVLPKSIERNTPHYPRLDSLGNNVFTRKEARKATPYFSIFLNDGGLY